MAQIAASVYSCVMSIDLLIQRPLRGLGIFTFNVDANFSVLTTISCDGFFYLESSYLMKISCWAKLAKRIQLVFFFLFFETTVLLRIIGIG